MLLYTLYKRETNVHKEFGPEYSKKFQSLDLNSRSDSKVLSHCTILPQNFHFTKMTVEKKIFSDEAFHSIFSHYIVIDLEYYF